MQLNRYTLRFGNLFITLALTVYLISATDTVAAPFDYVSDGINKISYIHYRSLSLDDKDVLELVDTACSMLVKLANDPNFDKLLKDFVSGHLKDPSSVKSILQDLDKFNQFLAEEQKVLEYYKYTPVATVDTLFTALSSRRWVDPSKVNVDFIKMSISALRDKTCSIRSNIATSQKQSDQLSMITMGIYGTGLVVVDGLAVWFSVGMASFIAPTSASIGGGMVGQAVYSLATAK